MEIEILVEGEGLEDIEAITVPIGSSARVIVEVIAAKAGFAADEALLFVEDGDEPLDLKLVVIDETTSKRIHHVHRSPHVEVVTFYKNSSIHRRFRPSARVQRVLDWVVGPDGFKIDSQIAPEMELALHDKITPLPKSAHIGRFIRHHQHMLELDLVRGVVPNGSSK